MKFSKGKFLGMILLLVVLTLVMTACRETNGPSIVSIEDVPENVEVYEGTTKTEVIEEKLPEEITVEMDDGTEEVAEVAWEAKDDYDPEETGDYVFEGSFEVQGIVESVEVNVLVLQQAYL